MCVLYMLLVYVFTLSLYASELFCNIPHNYVNKSFKLHSSLPKSLLSHS